MPYRGLKSILFGIQLVLIGGLLMFGLGPIMFFFGAGLSTGSGPGNPLVSWGPLPGLVLVIIGGIIGFRGYMRDD